MTDKQSKTIAFWITTTLVAFTIGSGGLAQLVRAPANVDGIVHLGYPPYLLTILGAWKVLGLAGLALASWALRPPSRVLGTISGAKGAET